MEKNRRGPIPKQALLLSFRPGHTREQEHEQHLTETFGPRSAPERKSRQGRPVRLWNLEGCLLVQ